MNARNLDRTIEHLDPRDHAILIDLERFRLLSTRHLQRLHFDQLSSNPVAAARACTRALLRLREEALITTLERRVGGVRRGSASYVWQLAARGDRLLRRLRGQPQRRRYIEPSRAFTEHTLAIADLATTLITAERNNSFTLEAIGTEPSNWRTLLGPAGETQWLKPDLHLVTSSDEFEDHAFVEIDRGTEHLPKILAKCRTYARYAATGAYQAQHGLFPAVVWLTDDPLRRAAITAAITNDPSLPTELFTANNPDGFIAAITDQREEDPHES